MVELIEKKIEMKSAGKIESITSEADKRRSNKKRQAKQSTMSAPAQAKKKLVIVKKQNETSEPTKKIFVVTYYAPQSIFAIPIGLDLEDKTVVESYGVNWNTLFITLVDGRELKVKASLDAEDNIDLKDPQDEEIQDNGEGYGEIDENNFHPIEHYVV